MVKWLKKLTWMDALGHLGYILMLGGNALIAHQIIWGWLVHLTGDVIWIYIGVKLKLSSIWFWQPVFVFSSMYGFFQWLK